MAHWFGGYWIYFPWWKWPYISLGVLHYHCTLDWWGHFFKKNLISATFEIKEMKVVFFKSNNILIQPFKSHAPSTETLSHLRLLLKSVCGGSFGEYTPPIISKHKSDDLVFMEEKKYGRRNWSVCLWSRQTCDESCLKCHNWSTASSPGRRLGPLSVHANADHLLPIALVWFHSFT